MVDVDVVVAAGAKAAAVKAATESLFLPAYFTFFPPGCVVLLLLVPSDDFVDVDVDVDVNDVDSLLASPPPVRPSIRRNTSLITSHDRRRLFGNAFSSLIVLYCSIINARTSLPACSMSMTTVQVLLLLLVDDAADAANDTNDANSFLVNSRMSINKARTKAGSSLVTSFRRRSATRPKIASRLSLSLVLLLS